MTFETLLEWAPQIVKDKLEGLKSLRERPDYHPEENAFEHTKIVTERLIKTGKPELILAGVFHDIFKAELAKINPKNGYPTSPGHDKAAAEFIRQNISETGGNISFSFFFTKVCQEFGGDILLVIKRTADICEQHMRIKEYSVMQKKKQQAFRDMDIFSDLLIFSEADDMLKEFNYPYSELFPTETHKKYLY